MTGSWRELIDMAVFGPVPEYVRVSILLSDVSNATNQPSAGAAAALLGRASRASRVSQASRTSHAEAEWAGDEAEIAAWLAAYESVGLPPDVLPPPRILAAWATLPDGVPSQGPLADLVNAFALQNVIPVAAYDLSAVEGDLWLRPSRGCEIYESVGGGTGNPPLGEMILADSADLVLARHWHGAQGRPVVVGSTTIRALVHLDLLPPLASQADTLAGKFARLATGFLGGSAEVRLLSWAAPQAVWH